MERQTSELRVLVLAPTGRDGPLISDMLKTADLPCSLCTSVEMLAEEIGEGAGLAIMAEEALIDPPLAPLLRVLAELPAWSDFPLLFLTTSGTRPSETSTDLLKLLGDRANVTILERPIRVATLLSSIQSGLRARRRQYQVRDYLNERERHREELLQTQKLESLGVLAGGVAHDFNNLLTGIMGNSSLALEMLPAGLPDIEGALRDVVTASERAADLTKQLLAYAGKGKFVIEPLNLSKVVEAVTHLVQAAVTKHAFLRMDLARDLPAFEGDASQMQQIIMNLVINAAESIPAGRGGEVFVRTSLQEVDERYVRENQLARDLSPGRYVMLEVRDTGSGMSPSTLGRIFDPFFTTKFTGRGLGLAAVQGIVRSHKGSLKVSTEQGHGSTFRILFPAVEAAEQAPVPKAYSVERTAGKGITVLVIDDEETVRGTAALTLKHYGYESVQAEDGAEGVEIFRASPDRFGLVLLDLTMPGLSGEEVFRQLKGIRPDTRIVVSSGFNEGEVVQRFTGQDLAGFVQKPYTSKTLAATLKRVWDRSAVAAK